MEDLTAAEEVRQNPKCDRRISLYGYVRGVPLRQDAPIHIPGTYQSSSLTYIVWRSVGAAAISVPWFYSCLI